MLQVPTSSNILILPSQFWQIRFESCWWLHCSKCQILVLLWYIIHVIQVQVYLLWAIPQLKSLFISSQSWFWFCFWGGGWGLVCIKCIILHVDATYLQIPKSIFMILLRKKPPFINVRFQSEIIRHLFGSGTFIEFNHSVCKGHRSKHECQYVGTH